MFAEAAAPALKLVEPSLRQSEFARSPDYVLYQGDSLALMAQMPAQSFDVIFADPPYFLSNGGTTCKSGKRVSVAKGQWDVSRGVEEDHAFELANVLNKNTRRPMADGLISPKEQDALPVSVVSRTTPSPGTEASFLQQLLGNIGRFNPAGGATPGIGGGAPAAPQ